MRPIHIDRNTKCWLVGAISVLVVFLIVFIFRNRFDQAVVLGVAVLTPVAWLLLSLIFLKFLR